jgi:hypothetical protein
MSDYRVDRCKTPAECEQFAKNVEKGHPDLAREARRRGVELRAAEQGATSPAEFDALRAVCAFEEVRSQETGRKARANRTRQSFERIGIVPTVEKIVSRKTSTDGYAALVEAGMDDFTFEAVVLRHQESFTRVAFEQAKKRIQERQTEE